jgi:adenylylsulfate kinase
MLLIQLTGLSGAGKTTLSGRVRDELQKLGLRVEIIDGDEYRRHLCRDLGFSRADRLENIRRLGFVGRLLARHGVIVLLAAINPYEEARRALRAEAEKARTVWIDCDLETLRRRDPKGLYRRAFLPDSDPEKLTNLTGVNDPFEAPADADLRIVTSAETEAESAAALLRFILEEIEYEA